MHILVTGAGGMIGRKLVERLLNERTLRGEKISQFTLHDLHAPQFDSDNIEITSHGGDFSDDGVAAKLLIDRPDVIFHLAAIVSGEAETEFEKGYRINLDGTRALIEEIKAAGNDYCPRLIFASSIAVFGAPFPEAIEDEFHLTPLTSYGTQKAICELLLTDFTRKGHLDGIGLRFPTIVVRPGKPNLAASGFFSNIMREPLAGEDAVLPVSKEVMHWMASPRSAVGFCIHAAELESAKIGPRRCLTLPGLAITVGEMIDALARVAGRDVAKRVKTVPDEKISNIVDDWPRQFVAKRALELGFVSESSFDEILQAHIEDELGGEISS